MNYTVTYRHKGFFCRKHKLKGVIGDGFVSDCSFPMRFFMTEKNERIEVPAVDTMFKFSPERFTMILKRMEESTGTTLPLKANP
jgi:hypothetical protein